MEERDNRRRGIVWPIILIGAGVVFLLNNLGVLPWSVWETLLRLWPLLLIAIGLDILIGRRSIWGSLLVALVLLAMLGGVLWLAVVQTDRANEGLTTQTINQPLNGVTRAEIEIDLGIGSLNINALNESAGLVEGKVVLSPYERLDREYRQSGDLGFFKLASEMQRGIAWPSLAVWFPVGRAPTWSEDKVWDLGLNRDVPIRLKLSTGIGYSTIDLTQLQVSDLEMHAGVGTATLNLPQRGQLSGRIESGVGQITIIVPSGMAVRVQVEGGLGGVEVQGNFVHSGNTYASPGYSTAEDRADLSVNGGVGRIIIQEGD